MYALEGRDHEAYWAGKDSLADAGQSFVDRDRLAVDSRTLLDKEMAAERPPASGRRMANERAGSPPPVNTVGWVAEEDEDSKPRVGEHMLCCWGRRQVGRMEWGSMDGANPPAMTDAGQQRQNARHPMVSPRAPYAQEGSRVLRRWGARGNERQTGMIEYDLASSMMLWGWIVAAKRVVA